MENAQKVVIDVPCGTEYLKMIRDIISGILTKVCVDSEILSQIQVAVTESCSNIIKHTDIDKVNQSYKVEFYLFEEIFRVMVNYNDMRFYPDCIGVPKLFELKEGGLGVFIIKSYMDKVVYIKDEDSGEICVIMEKELTQ